MPRTGAVPSSSFDHGVGRNKGVGASGDVKGKTKPSPSQGSGTHAGTTRLAIYNPAATTAEAPNAQTVETLLAFNKYISLSEGGFGLNLLVHPRFIEFQQKTGFTLSDIATSALKMIYFKDEQEVLSILKMFDVGNPGILPSQIFSLISQKDTPDSKAWNAYLEWLEPGEKLNQRLVKLKALAHQWIGGQDIDNMIESTLKSTGVGTWKCFGHAVKQAINKGVSVDDLHSYLDKLNTAGEYHLLGQCVLEAVNKGLITEKEKLESYLTELATRQTEEAKPDIDTSMTLAIKEAAGLTDVPILKEGKNYFPTLCHYIRVIASARGVSYEEKPSVNKLFEYEGVKSANDYGSLLARLVDLKAITQNEFNFHFEKLKQMCLDARKPVAVNEAEPKVDGDRPNAGGILGINPILPNLDLGNMFNNKLGINEEAIFDRDGLNMKHSNELLELKMKAYGSGVTTEKPDINYYLEFNKTNKNNKAVQKIISNSLANRIITEQEQFDRILINHSEDIVDRGNLLNLELGFSHSNFTDIVMLAKKHNVIQDVMPYFERLPEGSRFTFLQRGVKEKYITDLALVDSYIHKLEAAGKGSNALQLLSASLEAGVHKLDRSSFDELSTTASRNNVPLPFALAVENLKNQLGLTEEETRGYYECARTLFPAVREKNAKAERDDQKISTEVFELCSSPGLANLLAVSEPITGQILENVLQREGGLPILKNVFDTVAHLKPEEVQVLNSFCSSNEKLVQREPNFVIDLVGYLNAYKSLQITKDGASVIQTFENDLCKTSASIQAISRNLGETVIREICKPENLGLQIDIDKLTKERDILKEIDMRFLGPLVDTRRSWTEQERDVFALLLKSRLEDTHKGLLCPTEYGNYEPSVYGTEPKTQETVRQIREYNTKLVEEMKAKGLNVEAWLNPNEAVQPVIIVAGVQRRAVKIIEDFHCRFNELKKWMHGGFNNDPHLDSIIERKFRDVENLEERRTLIEGEKTKVKQQLGAMTERFWKGIEDELKGLLSAKASNKEKPILHLQNLYRQNQLNPKFKVKHKTFLDTLSQVFQAGGMPEAIADMHSIIREMNSYNPDNKMKGKNYGLRFWDRDPTREFAIGNRAGSCTALGSNSNAIFNFFRDVGTQYIPIVDPENNSLGYSSGEVKGDPVGYSRFWLATNTDDKPIVFIDTVDGMAAKANKDELFEHIIKLAQATGIDVHEERIIYRMDNIFLKVDKESGRIIKRKLEPNERPIKSKIGGFIEGYFHHSQGLMQPEVKEEKIDIPPPPEAQLNVQLGRQPDGFVREI